ncbi:branched-chain amino acid transport system II carrier protein [Blautia sp. An46]|uniref:branched-chain amino acid transport system II carrier protein n=1 Tax=Blautia sp. An46 TaxID=1965636 RepID=UPI000B38EEB8|nr:branched-chain amino acid transport system II carrier protein [Blautia sp. An46]OUN91719.1 branched-chain amino acid transport system II carrier protein [Blautia sp. An46]
MKKNMFKDILITGFAMFAIFFGSGNLIFPPQVGLLSGEYVFWAIGGLALSGILFPMLAVAAVGNVGYGLQDMMKHVTSWWHYLYMGLGLLVVIFGTIPRCGGVAYETGFEGIFGSLPVYARILFLLIFFGVSYYFAMNKSNVIDRIGKYLTPILLITLLVIILLAIFQPMGAIGGGLQESGQEAFLSAFLTGYNTGDVGTGIICAGIFIAAFREKGYTGKEEYKKMMFGIIVIGFLLLFIVYGGLAYLGAQGGSDYPADVDTTYLLTDLVRRLAGSGGSIVLSLAVIFACLTTAVGMIATTGQWVEEWTKGKIPYKWASLIITIAIFLVSSTGVSNVLTISGPIFTILFPMSVVMMILGLFKKFVPNDGAWKGAVIVSAVMSLFDALNVAQSSGLIPIDVSGIMNIIYKIPFARQGFAWAVPTIIGFFVGAVIYKVRGKESIPYTI